jgi:hypothetical protein
LQCCSVAEAVLRRVPAAAAAVAAAAVLAA